jgi:hypothetical protein
MYSGYQVTDFDLIAANNITIVYLVCYKISELPGMRVPLKSHRKSTEAEQTPGRREIYRNCQVSHE